MLRPQLEKQAREDGPLRVLILMEGWPRLGRPRCRLGGPGEGRAPSGEHVERLVMVGDEDWERWMTEISKPFAKSTLCYFDRSQLDEAWAWIRA